VRKKSPKRVKNNYSAKYIQNSTKENVKEELNKMSQKKLNEEIESKKAQDNSRTKRQKMFPSLRGRHVHGHFGHAHTYALLQSFQ